MRMFLAVVMSLVLSGCAAVYPVYDRTDSVESAGEGPGGGEGAGSGEGTN